MIMYHYVYPSFRLGAVLVVCLVMFFTLPGSRTTDVKVAPLEAYVAGDNQSNHDKVAAPDQENLPIPDTVAAPDQEYLPIPNTVKYLYINIGTSWVPYPGCNTAVFAYNPEVFCIYVDPLFRVNQRLRESGIVNNSTLMFLAAVSDKPGVAAFNEYAGTNGAASSLATVSQKYLNDNPQMRPTYQGVKSAVSVITLASILKAIRPDIRILQLKTDMQGFDFTAILAAGTLLRRIDEIICECIGIRDVDHIYDGIDNSALKWTPRIQKLGFYPVYNISHDCYYVRSSSKTPPERVPGMVYIDHNEIPIIHNPTQSTQ